MNEPFLPHSLSRAGLIFRWALLAFLIASVFCAVWIGVRGAMAFKCLERVQSGAVESVQTLASDPSSAAPTVARLASDAAEARSLTSDAIWQVGESLPWFGPQLRAFSTVASSSDTLLRQSLLPLVSAADGVSIETLKPTAGHIDTDALADIEKVSRISAEHAKEAANALLAVDQAPLLGVVSSAVDRASTVFGEVAAAVDGVSRTSRLMPTMLGKDAPRTYLVLVQNNAEWRSLGGISGTALLLRADGGTLSLLSTQSATSLVRDVQEPVVNLPADLTSIYGTRPARYFHNLTQIPDFTVDGPLARKMFQVRTGTVVDGVLAVDPVVLSYMLNATGPVSLPDGQVLSTENAVNFLLNDVYLRYSDPARQDEMFAAATSAVFQALLDGRSSMPGLISAFARAADERRFLLWSANPDEESIIEGSTVAGELPTSDAQTARFGVYLNDGTGSKMTFYVKPTVSFEWQGCGSSARPGDQDVTLKLTLENTAPIDAGRELPEYVTGGGSFGIVPGDANIVTNIYLPEGSQLLSAESTDKTTFATAAYAGRDVITFGTALPPQSATTITVTARFAPDTLAVQALVTPTADAALSPTVSAECQPASAAQVR